MCHGRTHRDVTGILDGPDRGDLFLLGSVGVGVGVGVVDVAFTYINSMMIGTSSSCSSGTSILT